MSMSTRTKVNSEKLYDSSLRENLPLNFRCDIIELTAAERDEIFQNVKFFVPSSDFGNNSLIIKSTNVCLQFKLAIV
jgi:hypothetical protein